MEKYRENQQEWGQRGDYGWMIWHFSYFSMKPVEWLAQCDPFALREVGYLLQRKAASPGGSCGVVLSLGDQNGETKKEDMIQKERHKEPEDHRGRGIGYEVRTSTKN